MLQHLLAIEDNLHGWNDIYCWQNHQTHQCRGKDASPFSLSGQMLYDVLLFLICVVHDNDGRVFLCRSDNYKANISTFNMFHSVFKSLNGFSIEHPLSDHDRMILFLLYDWVHILKTLRNNWFTEKMQKLKFYDIQTGKERFAEWKHIKKIYREEENCIVKQTTLTYAAIFPSSFDKQKVHLALCVFNEKPVAALKMRGHNSTAEFSILLYVCVT